MRVLRGIEGHEKLRCVATIGNFDGVHLGHQAMLNRLNQASLTLGLPALVVIFEPQPREFFGRGTAPVRLMSFREKIVAFEKAGIDYVLCLAFNQKLASLSPDNFLKKVLCERLQVRFLLTGEDFRFGSQRRGNVAMLQEKCKGHGIELEVFNTKVKREHKISSTAIREALFDNDFLRAETYLGYKYFISSRVVEGDKRGRTVGIPTANLLLKRRHTALKGVFCVKIRLPDNRVLNGVANLGVRPTVDGKRLFLETHIFDFDETIYNEIIQVVFIDKLRDEKHFDSFPELIKQIHNDIATAKDRLKAHERV